MNFVGLPTDGNVEEFQTVCENTEGHDPEPMTRITALLASEEQVCVKIYSHPTACVSLIIRNLFQKHCILLKNLF